MLQLQGIGTKGLATGKALVVYRDNEKRHYQRGDIVHELSVVKQSLEELKKHLKLHAQESDVFSAHLEMADDPMLWETIKGHIENENKDAPTAIETTSSELEALFHEMDDAYLQARADDVKDICNQLKNNLFTTVHKNCFEKLESNSILVIEELLPSDMANIDFSKLSGIITEKGSRTSHVCIIASNKGLPIIVGVKKVLEQIQTSDIILLDADKGVVHVRPDEETFQQFKCQIISSQDNLKTISSQALLPAITRQGRHVPVLANAGNLESIKKALEFGADGIGLFRSEFLFMDKVDMPDEETQFQIYFEAARLCNNKTLTIRTMDVGGDKYPSFLHLDKEENPFLGMRGIRLCLLHVEMFKTQLRAILRASVLGNVKIMLPFISDMNELDKSWTLIEECKKELQSQHLAFDSSIKIGMMIETPSTVFMASEYAPKVDFFSIGTNDLTQYIMAADRGNAAVKNYYNSSHPAVLKAIQQVVNAAHQCKIPVSICGELASDSTMIQQILDMGIDVLSVNISAIAQVKDRIRQIN